MSLTTILKDKATRAELKPYIRPPKMPDRPPPEVKWRSFPPRMGTAVDYAIRFGLEVRGGYPPQEHIVADDAVALVRSGRTRARLRMAVIDRWLGALYDLGDLHATPELRPSVAFACLRLAGLDVIYRAQRFDDLLWTPDALAIGELRDIYALTPWSFMRPQSWGVLNPTFGEGSGLMNGADADIAFDGCLVEIKTVSETRPALEHIRQLVAYALLANRHGIDGAPAGARIDSLALLFTRAGHFFRFPLDACIDPAYHDTVLDILVREGARQRGDIPA